MRPTVTAAVLGLLCAGALAQQDAPANLVVNGDFEDGATGWRTNPERRIEEVPDAPSGSHALVMECKEEQYYFAIAGPDVPIEPRKLYRIRATIKRLQGGGYLRIGGGLQDADGQGLTTGRNWSLSIWPISIMTGEGRGDWITHEATFMVSRTDAARLALRVMLRNGVDTIYVDDVVIDQLRRPEAPELVFPDDLTWPGRPSLMGMRVEEASVTDEGAVVVTTGARYRFDPMGESVTCIQRIPDEREVASFSFDPPLGPLKLLSADDDVIVLTGDGCALSVGGDSLIALGTNTRRVITVTSKVGARHAQMVSDNLMVIDDTGGFCVYPEQRLEYETEPSEFTAMPEDMSAPGWSATLQAAARKRVGIAVFPPRPYPWEQSFTDRIAHANRYPTDELIHTMAEHCNILVLHQGIYRGASSSGPYVIEDDAEYARVIATAHAAGMQVLPYFNPGAYSVQDVELALELLQTHRDRYGTNGFYFDGLYRKDEWPKSYHFIRRVREMVGDNCIYAHTTLNPPAGRDAIYCPFVDTWCDFLLRGEGQRIDGTADPYLRYVVGTWNISNCIPTLKGDKMEGADERQQLEAMLELNGRARWGYPGTNADRDRLFTEWYFPHLDELYRQWQAEQ